MIRFLLVTLALLAPALAEPLRIAVATDAPAASEAWVKWLSERGLTATPADLSANSLEKADVVLLQRGNTEKLPPAAQEALISFAQRGGGLVFLNQAIAANAPNLSKSLAGAAWSDRTRSFTSLTMLYLATDIHPVAAASSAYDVSDVTVYDYDLADSPNLTVIASAFTPKLSDRRDDNRPPADPNKANIFDCQPQWWLFENTLPGGKPHRSFTALQSGETLAHPAFRATLLRALHWTAKRENLDESLTPADHQTLRYPPGGPRPAADTVAQLTVEPGFKVSVIAAEPLINKPIAIQWDAAGRLWVAESPEYPNGRRESAAPHWRDRGVLDPGNYDRPARDRISILTHPDENGQFTQKTIFHEGLELVTGFCLYRDGVIAVAHPHIVWIRDTDGDGKSDQSVPLFSGFTPGDTHFVANHFIAAPDGWIYASMGGGADAKSLTHPGVEGRVSAGVFRFRPDGSAIEQVSSKGGNGFGIDLTSDGELFFSQATTGNPIQHVALTEKTLALGKIGNASGAISVNPGRRAAVPKLQDRASLRQIDVVGGYTAACSSLIHEGGAWPAPWDNSLFCTEPLLNLVHREVLKPTDATFLGEMVRTDREFIHSPDDYWFRPIDVAPGPDGAIYLLDFYNPVVAHNDTRGPLHSRSGASVRPDREHHFGRIYRVQHEKAKTLEIPNLLSADPAAIAEVLTNPNRPVRFNALNRLIDFHAAAAPALLKPLTTEPSPPATRTLALWGLHRLNSLDAATLTAALKAKSPAVRKTAALILEDAKPASPTAALAEGLADPDPRTRIAFLRALAATKLDEPSAAALVALFPTLTDDLTRSAAVAATASDRPGVLRAVLLSKNPDALTAFAASIADSLIEQRDSQAFAKLLPALATAPPAADPLKIQLLEKATRLPKPDAVDSKSLQALLTAANPTLRAAALPIAMAWDTSPATRKAAAPIVPALLTLAKDPAAPEPDRLRAVQSLIGARAASADILPAISALLTDAATPLPVRRAALDSLRATEDPAAGQLVVAAFPALDSALQPPAFEMLVSRIEWITAFLAAAEKDPAPLALLGPNDLFRLRSHPSPEISKRATALIDKLHQPSPDKEKLLADLLPKVTQGGDPVRGKEQFALACAVCHRLGGEGKEVGPALDGLGAHGPEQLLISIVDPNRQIDAGYELYNLETHDGTLHAGLITRQNDARVVLRSIAGEVEIPANTIKTRTNTRRSLMPEGLEALGADSLRDILAYLTQGSSKYRILNLSRAFTADTRQGLYASREATGDTLRFRRFGIVPIAGVPFNIVDPSANPLGGNLIVLRGGGPNTHSGTLPDTVEIPVGHPVKNLHFLGGVAGWGATDPGRQGVIMTVTAHFADGKTEEFPLYNGEHFSDYIRRIDVPGSKFAEGIVHDKQIRTFTLPIKNTTAILEKLTLTSPGGPAPTTAAITAELPE
jgi:putative membrane-bound dehydrogenase-like protein